LSLLFACCAAMASANFAGTPLELALPLYATAAGAGGGKPESCAGRHVSSSLANLNLGATAFGACSDSNPAFLVSDLPVGAIPFGAASEITSFACTCVCAEFRHGSCASC